MTREIKRSRTITYLKLKQTLSLVRRLSRRGNVNADFALNPVNGKGSNAWVLNWIYPEMLINRLASLFFFYNCLNLPVIHSVICFSVLHFLPYIQGLCFCPACATDTITNYCVTVCVTTLWSQRNC